MAKNGARGLIGGNFGVKARKRRARCVGAVVTALLTAAMLVPAQAFAATELTIDGSATPYTSAASGTGWTWDGADALDLNNYNGGAIEAVGNLDITSTGTNVVTRTDGDAAISTDAALTISGTGTLEASSTKDAADEQSPAAGIYAESVTIDGTTVTATGDTTVSRTGAYGIYGGSVTIQNGANVTAKASSIGTGCEATGILVVNGDINISDSTVSATGSGPADAYHTGGLSAMSIGSNGGNITIANSAVKASGGMAIDATTSSASTPGVITITGSQIVAPEGYVVRNIAFDNFYGQVIGAPGTDTITDNNDPAIASSVELAVPAPAPTDNTTQQVSTATDALPRTGDNTTGLAVFGALGLVGLGLLGIRRFRRQARSL